MQQHDLHSRIKPRSGDCRPIVARKLRYPLISAEQAYAVRHTLRFRRSQLPEIPEPPGRLPDGVMEYRQLERRGRTI